MDHSVTTSVNSVFFPVEDVQVEQRKAREVHGHGGSGEGEAPGVPFSLQEHQNVRYIRF